MKSMYGELQGRNGSLRKVLQTGMTCVFVCEGMILHGKGRQAESLGKLSCGGKILVQRRYWTENWYYVCVYLCLIFDGKGRQGEKVGKFSRGVKIEVQKRYWTANWYYVCVKVCLAYVDRVGGNYLRCKEMVREKKNCEVKIEIERW